MKKFIIVLFAAQILFAGCYLLLPKNGNEDEIFDPAATELTVNTWADSIITENGNGWFKFTATADVHYIHVSFGTLDSFRGMYIELYNSDGKSQSNRTNLNNSKRNVLYSFTVGQKYYLKIIPYHIYNPSSDSYTGTYKIAFNMSSTEPTTIKLPSDAARLTAVDAWADGELLAKTEEQWFKFTATADTQYIHISLGTLASGTGLYIQLYNNSNGYGDPVGEKTQLNSNTRYIKRALVTGQEYYIKITPYNDWSAGTYKIAFNTLPITPGTDITKLDANTWANGSIISNTSIPSGEQWFRFTAAAETQYIHVSIEDSLVSMYIQLYNNDGNIGDKIKLSQSYFDPIKPASFVSLIIGKDYYIKVTPYTGSITYKITFNTSETPPSQ